MILGPGGACALVRAPPGHQRPGEGAWAKKPSIDPTSTFALRA